MLVTTLSDLARAAWLAVALCIVYPLGTIVYNLAFHPLARFPGPLLWRSTRLAYMWSMWSGRTHVDYHRLHRKYGPVVRIAPNELSFADTQAWEDIYSNRGGSLAFPKTFWHAPQAGRAISITTALDRDDHAKIRKKMQPGFTEQAVAKQEHIVQGYVSLFIQRLHERTSASPSPTIVLDVAQWFTFIFLDMIGDLAFGEDFGCLKRSQMNEWMALLFGSIKAQVLFATLRHYPLVTWAREKLIPKSVMEKGNHHWQSVEEKVGRRLSRSVSRPDFIELWQKDGKGKDGLTFEEICANSFMITFAGSETLATTLTGTIHWLVKRPHKLALLTQEIRDRFQKEEDITFAAVREMPYLHGAIWEGLRMCNATPLGSLRLVPPEGGIVCGHWIPRDTLVSVNVVALAFDPARFHDAHEFHPERWLPEASNDFNNPFFHDDKNAVQPFSVGPKNCIGKTLALSEMKLTLARLLWAFDVEEADTERGRLVWDDQKSYTVVEKWPFEVKLRERMD